MASSALPLTTLLHLVDGPQETIQRNPQDVPRARDVRSIDWTGGDVAQDDEYASDSSGSSYSSEEEIITIKRKYHHHHHGDGKLETVPKEEIVSKKVRFSAHFPAKLQGMSGEPHCMAFSRLQDCSLLPLFGLVITLTVHLFFHQLIHHHHHKDPKDSKDGHGSHPSSPASTPPVLRHPAGHYGSVPVQPGHVTTNFRWVFFSPVGRSRAPSADKEWSPVCSPCS